MGRSRREAQERFLAQVEGHIQGWLSPDLHNGSTEARLRGLAHSILYTLDGGTSSPLDSCPGYRVRPRDTAIPFLDIAGDLGERMPSCSDSKRRRACAASSAEPKLRPASSERPPR